MKKTLFFFSLFVSSLLLNFRGNAQTHSVAFDSSTGTIDLGNNYSFDLDSVFTVEAWVKSTNQPGLHQIISKLGTNLQGWGFQYDADNESLSIYFIHSFSATDMVFYECPVSISDGAWHHVAMIYDGSDNIYQIFVDGIEELGSSSGTITGNAITTAPARIGSYEGAGSPDEFWDGNIDEIRIWRGARTEAEIMADKDCPLAGNEPGLIGYWDLEDGTGSVATDHSGMGINGTFIGSADWTTDQALNCNTGVDDLNIINESIQVLPNPFNGVACIKTGIALKDGKLEIYNYYGQKVQTYNHLKGQTHFIQRNDLPDGIYLLCLTESHSLFTKKISILSN